MKHFVLSFFCLFLLVGSAFSANKKVVLYWGQDGASVEPTLGQVCANSKASIINIGFADVFFDTTDNNLPQINLSDHCGDTFPGTQLLHCPDVAADIKSCQQAGVQVTMSLGGSAGSYGFSSADQANLMANNVWNMFLGGSDSSIPRPFDDAVLDGVDLDIEGGPGGALYGNFVQTLRGLTSGANKQYIISGAPQCPFPDAYLGPGIAAAGNDFDNLYVQFYNNYCSIGSGSSFNFNQWVTNVSSNIQIFVGVPAAPGAGGGYVPASQLYSILQPILGDDRFGGVMIWDAGWNQQTNYSVSVAQFLN